MPLRYATNAGNGTDWVVEKIADAAPGANIVSSITTDAGTRLPTVDFFDLPSGVLSRATRDAGGNWDTNARHTVTDVASDAAIATDAAGKVHLAYIDSVTNDIKYVTDAVAQGADVKVSQSHPAAAITISQQVEYTVTVTNLGADAATNVVLTDTLPAGSTFISATNGSPIDPGQVCWNIGGLAKGASVATTITVQAPAVAGTMTNLASVSAAANQDFKSANNEVSVSDPVTVPKHPLVLAVLDGVGGTLNAQPVQSAYDEGSTITVVATPDPGYQVKSWAGTLDDTLKTTTNTVLIGNGDKTTVQVTFEKIQWQLTVIVVGGHGTVNPNGGLYGDLTTVTLTAKPERHYGIKKWTGTNDDASNDLGNVVTMDKNRTVTVEFQPVANRAPVPLLVLPSVVYAGDEVTLDGSTSYDPDDEPITYKWEEVDIQHVTLSGATTDKATFTAPDVPKGQEDMMLEFRLTVTDDGGLSGMNPGIVKIVPKIPCGPCGSCVGPANLIGFYVLCWAGMAYMKWGPRTGRRHR